MCKDACIEPADGKMDHLWKDNIYFCFEYFFLQNFVASMSSRWSERKYEKNCYVDHLF